MKCQKSGFLGADTAKMLIETKPEVIPQLPLKPLSDLANRIIKYMLAKNYHIGTGKREYNIVYVEGMDADGISNLSSNRIFLHKGAKSWEPVMEGARDNIAFHQATDAHPNCNRS